MIKKIVLFVLSMSLLLLCSCGSTDEITDDVGENSSDNYQEDSAEAKTLSFKEYFAQDKNEKQIWYQVSNVSDIDGEFSFGRSSEIHDMYVFEDGKMTVYGNLDIEYDQIAEWTDEEIIQAVKQYVEEDDSLGSGAPYAKSPSQYSFDLEADESGNSTSVESVRCDSEKGIVAHSDSNIDQMVYDNRYIGFYEEKYRSDGSPAKIFYGYVTKDDTIDYIYLDQP